MNKINFRFNLLEARFPDLYQEAKKKMAGGVERKDVVADWLNELVCRRGMSNYPTEKPTTETETTDNIDFAKGIMDSLVD